MTDILAQLDAAYYIDDRSGFWSPFSKCLTTRRIITTSRVGNRHFEHVG